MNLPPHPRRSGKTRLRWLVFAAASLFPASLLAVPGLDSPEPVGAYFNGAFPTSAPGSAGGWTVVDAFPNLSFIDPVNLVPEPRSNRLHVVGKDGFIWSFVNQSTTSTKTLVLDIRTRVQSTDNAGLTGLAFHPEFNLAGSSKQRYFYVMYYYTPTPLYLPALDTDGDGALQGDETINHTCIRLSRFTMNPDGLTADPASEFVLLQQFDRQAWHNGCALCFGPDGYLYFAIGDEGLDSDFYRSMQKFNERLWGGVFRIDVDWTPSSTRSHAIRRQPVFTPVAPVGSYPDASKLNPAPALGTTHTYSQGYGIPNDNPWVDPTGARLEEYYAIGVRSPHTLTCDPETGELWLGDVGQATWEEVNKIVKGGDYQWPYKEGAANFNDTDWGQGFIQKTHTLPSTPQPPIHAYTHNAAGGTAVIGGFVYRGREHAAALYGQYLFTDHGNPTISHIWRLPPGSSTPTLLTDMPSGGFHWNVANWGMDHQGEPYLIRLGRAAGADAGNAFVSPMNASGAFITKAENGKIFKLARTTTNVPEPAALLSQTGVFQPFGNSGPLNPVSGFLPYAPASPFWSDNAEKQRWVAIPNDGTHNTAGERITYHATNEWAYPPGTVFMKHFDLPVSDVDPTQRKRLETRFLIKDNTATTTSWYGLTYRWRDDQSDADLLYTGQSRSFSIATSGGGTRTQTWSYPSRSDCLTCHGAVAGSVLGFRLHSLNHEFFYAKTNRRGNQVETFAALGILNPAPTLANIAAAPASVHFADKFQPLETRARSYIDANCAYCHRPGGAAANWDGRFTTPLASAAIFDGTLRKTYGISAAERVAVRQNPTLSILYRRTNLLGGTGNLTQMPPLGKNVLDTQGEQLLFDWISTAGLAGEYYNNITLTGTPSNRIDTEINFNWGSASPFPTAGVPVDNFSVRWRGRIFAKTTGLYTLYVNADGGVRLILKDSVILDRWTDSASPVKTPAYAYLAGGQYADFRLEKYHKTGLASCQVTWEGPGFTETALPSAHFTSLIAGDTRPVANHDVVQCARGRSVTFSIVANDTDAQGPVDASSVTLLNQPQYGTLTVHPNGSATYTHNDNFLSTQENLSYIVADNKSNSSVIGGITINIIPRHQVWLESKFTAAELANPSISGWTQDPDKDGVPNLLEWAFGGEPKDRASQPRPKLSMVATPSGTKLQLEVIPNPDNNTTLAPETSTNLTTWVHNDPAIEIVENSTTRFITRIPIAAGGKKYFRIRAVLPVQ